MQKNKRGFTWSKIIGFIVTKSVCFSPVIPSWKGILIACFVIARCIFLGKNVAVPLFIQAM